MLLYGYISECDPAKGLARVEFRQDGIVSDWLPMAVTNSKDNKYTFAFDINEHVCCLMEDNMSNGVILCAIYDSTNEAGGNKDKVKITFSDGGSVEYDRASSKLTIDTSGEVDITASKVKITGDLEVSGEVKAQGNIESTTGNLTAAVKVSAANIEATADVTAGAGVISLLLHKHISAAPASPTSPAIP
jgi:phage baseplate assembly protein V